MRADGSAAPAPMGVAIEIALVAGRFHATPWDRHVNEGSVEWPPSPWRILRALVSTWHLRAKDDVDEATLERLLARLAVAVPIYQIPPASEGHTRHFMPQFQTGKTAKVFDAFVHVEGDRSLRVLWPGLQLDGPERAALELLLGRLSYLGRAEAWADGRVIDGVVAGVLVHPAEDARACGEAVRLLAPLPEDELQTWRAGVIEERMRQRLAEKRAKVAAKGKDPARTGLSAKEEAAIEAGLPRTLLEVLEADTSTLSAQGWSRPPGTRWLTWLRPARALAVSALPQPAPVHTTTATFARFALDSAVLPRITDAISVGDRIHKTLIRISGGLPVFRGQDDHGRPLAGHRHVYILPEVDCRQRISHVTLHAPMGFDGAARQALDQLGLCRIWGRDAHDIQLLLLGIGDGAALGAPMVGASRTWVSATPFVPTRDAKRHKDGRPKLDAAGHQIAGPEHEVQRLLVAQGFPAPAKVEQVDLLRTGARPLRSLQFRLGREEDHGRRGANRGWALRLSFAEPVAGPLALGFGAHFGLGVFMPVDE